MNQKGEKNMITKKNFGQVKILILGFMIGYITHAVITQLRTDGTTAAKQNTSEVIAKH
ncbi:MAG: hypothetical protein NWR39_00580 [Pseudomonadota bacterium]|nr:hypothetical protein [Alphaproteobacteria bacterium]MDP5370060.1 hypothetical protein [Pseudomonadota bacterium]